MVPAFSGVYCLPVFFSAATVLGERNISSLSILFEASRGMYEVKPFHFVSRLEVCQGGNLGETMRMLRRCTNVG